MIRNLCPLPPRPGGNAYPSRVAAVAAASWTPAQIGGALLWVRGDVATASTSRVSSWTDQSGSGNHVTSVGATSTRPLLTTWAAGNNQPALYFDGARSLATAGNILPTANGAGFSIFMVGSFDDLNFRCALLTNGTSGGVAISQNGGGSGKLQEWKLGVTFNDDGAATTSPLNVVLVDQIGSTPATEFYVNGALATTTGANDQVGTPSGKLYLGASATTNFHKGFLGEILMVPWRASSSLRAQWNTYTLARYGV